jgi:hypothetical protein
VTPVATNEIISVTLDNGRVMDFYSTELEYPFLNRNLWNPQLFHNPIGIKLFLR